MIITQQAFADAVIKHVAENPTQLDPNQCESQVGDHWTFRAEGQAMSGSPCFVYHGMFDRAYNRTVILPRAWDNFCEQFCSPEARLLMQLHREYQQPSWLTWDPAEAGREDFPMTRNFWTHKHQDRTYAALIEQLRQRGLTTEPNRSYTDDEGTFGVKIEDRVVDFPGTYRTLDFMMDELVSDTRHVADIPRDVKRYGDSVPVLHMIGDTMDTSDDELRELIAKHSLPTPKEQQVVYVFLEQRDGQLTARRIGCMLVSVLEVAEGSLAGAVHSDMIYIVPNDLSPDEEKSFCCSNIRWGMHRTGIIERCPAIASTFSLAA